MLWSLRLIAKDYMDEFLTSSAVLKDWLTAPENENWSLVIDDEITTFTWH